MAVLKLPTPLRSYTGGKGEVAVQGSTVGEAMDDLTRAFPSLRPHLFNDQGQLRAFVNLYLNDEDVRHLQGVQTPLRENDKLILIPSIAGGRE